MCWYIDRESSFVSGYACTCYFADLKRNRTPSQHLAHRSTGSQSTLGTSQHRIREDRERKVNLNATYKQYLSSYLYLNNFKEKGTIQKEVDRWQIVYPSMPVLLNYN